MAKLNTLQVMSLTAILKQFQKPLFENEETHFARLEFNQDQQQIILKQFNCEFKELETSTFDKDSRGAARVMPALKMILAGIDNLTAFLQRENNDVNLMINGNDQQKITL